MKAPPGIAAGHVQNAPESVANAATTAKSSRNGPLEDWPPGTRDQYVSGGMREPNGTPMEPVLSVNGSGHTAYARKSTSAGRRGFVNKS